MITSVILACLLLCAASPAVAFALVIGAFAPVQPAPDAPQTPWCMVLADIDAAEASAVVDATQAPTVVVGRSGRAVRKATPARATRDVEAVARFCDAHQPRRPYAAPSGAWLEPMPRTLAATPAAPLLPPARRGKAPRDARGRFCRASA